MAALSKAVLFHFHTRSPKLLAKRAVASVGLARLLYRWAGHFRVLALMHIGVPLSFSSSGRRRDNEKYGRRQSASIFANGRSIDTTSAWAATPSEYDIPAAIG